MTARGVCFEKNTTVLSTAVEAGWCGLILQVVNVNLLKFCQNVLVQTLTCLKGSRELPSEMKTQKKSSKPQQTAGTKVTIPPQTGGI